MAMRVMTHRRKDGKTEGQKDGSDSMTSTADAGGNNISKYIVRDCSEFMTWGQQMVQMIQILKTLQNLYQDLSSIVLVMRNRDPHRENVENILAICLLILTMQHIREYPSASHTMRRNTL